MPNIEPDAHRMSVTDIEKLQIAREDCRVGDWVEEITVPEWRGEEEVHTFTSGGIDISPDSRDFGGMSPGAKPDVWTFAPEELDGTRIWRRQS